MNKSLSTETIKAMLAGCEGVTPGPWVRVNETQVRLAVGWKRIASTVAGPDAAHIARCDPQTIAALCGEVLALRKWKDDRTKPENDSIGIAMRTGRFPR